MTGADAARAYAALYGPSAADLCRSIPDVADGLHGQLCELSARPTVDGAEQLASNLDGARRAVLRLRERLLAEGSGDAT
jgi:hypothetical protein